MFRYLDDDACSICFFALFKAFLIALSLLFKLGCSRSSYIAFGIVNTRIGALKVGLKVSHGEVEQVCTV